MSQAALLRRLRNQQQGYGCLPPGRGFGLPREQIEIEQDYARIQLASELLKIAAEVSTPEKFSEAADFALLAAARIYPELPEEALLVDPADRLEQIPEQIPGPELLQALRESTLGRKQ